MNAVVFLGVDPESLSVLARVGQNLVVLGGRVAHADAGRGEVVRVGPGNGRLGPHQKGPVLVGEGISEEKGRVSRVRVGRLRWDSGACRQGMRGKLFLQGGT